jgi:hypothetical protein
MFFLVSRNTKLNKIHHQFHEISHVSRINIFREISFCFVSSQVSFICGSFRYVSSSFVSFHKVNIFAILTKSIKKQYCIGLIYFYIQGINRRLCYATIKAMDNQRSTCSMVGGNRFQVELPV